MLMGGWGEKEKELIDLAGINFKQQTTTTKIMMYYHLGPNENLYNLNLVVSHDH